MFIAIIILAIVIVFIAFLKLKSKNDRLEEEDLEFMNAYKNHLKSKKEKQSFSEIYEIIKNK